MKGGFWRVAEGSEGVGLWTLVPNSCMLQEGPGGKELGTGGQRVGWNSWKLMFCEGCGRRMGGFGKAELWEFRRNVTVTEF